MADILKKFSKSVQTIITTHSPNFVPRDKSVMTLIIDKQETEPYTTYIVDGDYEKARETLGVTLVDSMYLYPHNIVVEGPSDEIILKHCWELFYKDGVLKTDPADIKFIVADGCVAACKIFQEFLTYANTDEADIKLIIDGDKAGAKSLNGLIARTKDLQKIKANTDYFQLKTDIEWLTSYRVMEKIAESTSLATITKNTNDEITAFVVNNSNKIKVAKRIVELSDKPDLEDHKALLKLIEKSFAG